MAFLHIKGLRLRTTARYCDKRATFDNAAFFVLISAKNMVFIKTYASLKQRWKGRVTLKQQRLAQNLDHQVVTANRVTHKRSTKK